VNGVINDSHLKMFFQEKFGMQVNKVLISTDKPTIIFTRDFLDKGMLKSVFKLGLKNRMSRYRKLQDQEYEESAKFKSSIFSSN
jgi:hypothetical protein